MVKKLYRLRLSGEQINTLIRLVRDAIEKTSPEFADHKQLLLDINLRLGFSGFDDEKRTYIDGYEAAVKDTLNTLGEPTCL